MGANLKQLAQHVGTLDVCCERHACRQGANFFEARYQRTQRDIERRHSRGDYSLVPTLWHQMNRKLYHW